MAELSITKQCTACKEIKPISEFHKDRSRKDGLQRKCKICRKAYDQTEKGKAVRQVYQQSEQGKVVRFRYLQSEKGKAYQKRYWQSEKCKATQKRYEQTDKCKAARKAYRQSEKGRAAQKRHDLKQKAKYPEQIKARNAVNHAIAAGKLPHPDTLQCSCGEQAKHYHHHKGYEPEHWLDVVPACLECHTKLRNQG